VRQIKTGEIGMGEEEIRFEWHQKKAAENLYKHGVSFEEAATVFNNDKHYLLLLDVAHSIEEERLICIGYSANGNLLTISHVEKEENLIRIISARQSTRAEK
jgi:uncharacterized protein